MWVFSQYISALIGLSMRLWTQLGAGANNGTSVSRYYVHHDTPVDLHDRHINTRFNSKGFEYRVRRRPEDSQEEEN